MNDLVDTTEMYLRTIYDLEEEGVVPLRARIAERLEQSGPTVSQTVARMERDGLVRVAGDRHLELTDKGAELERHLMERQRARILRELPTSRLTMLRAASTSAGNISRTREERMIAVWVTSAPMAATA